MIGWWGWLLMWVGLVLMLLMMLAAVAYVLFRKGLALMHDLSALVDKAAALDVDTESLSKPQIAVLAEMSEIRARHEAQKSRRADLKLERHDRRMARAKRIIKHDASTSPWPDGWA